MRIREAEKKYSISDKILKQYVKSGFLLAQKTSDGSLDLEEQYLEDLGLIHFLVQAGFSEETIRQYLELSRKEGTEKECVRILRKQRGVLLEDIHERQKLLDNLDFIVWKMQNGT